MAYEMGGEGVAELVGGDALALHASLLDDDLQHAVDAPAVDGVSLPGTDEQVATLRLGALGQVGLDLRHRLLCQRHHSLSATLTPDEELAALQVQIVQGDPH